MDSKEQEKEYKTEGKFTIYRSGEHLIVKHQDYENYLHFDLLNGNVCSEKTKETFMNTELALYKTHPHAIIGVISLDKWKFLLIVSGYDLVGCIDKKELYTVKEVDLVTITKEEFQPSEEMALYINGIKTLFITGFYYSFEYDLTNSAQRIKFPKSDTPHHQESLYYNYNYNLKKELLDAKINSIFMINMIHGYVGIGKLEDLNGEEVGLTLISRRSRYMAGTIFSCKGIDKHGNCANFVETEQITKISNKTYSFVIYRGSPPLFITNNTLNSDSSIKIVDVPNELKSSSLNKHIALITTKEKFNIFFLNLLSDTVHDESLLNKHIQINMFPIHTSTGASCKYYKIDINKAFETNNFFIIENFIQHFMSIQNSFISYYCDDSKYKSSFLQKGVIRVNCMNGLDRTNVFQAALCWKIFEAQVSLIYLFNTRYLQ